MLPGEDSSDGFTYHPASYGRYDLKYILFAVTGYLNGYLADQNIVYTLGEWPVSDHIAGS